VFTEARDGRELEREYERERASGVAPVQRCPASCVRELAASSILRSFVTTLVRDTSARGSRSDGGAGKTLKAMMSSSPEAGDALDAGPSHADDAEFEEEESSCASDEVPPGELDESLIRSGVPVSEVPGDVNSEMGEICKDLPTLSKFVVSNNSWSRELLPPVACALSSEATLPLPCPLVGRPAAGLLMPAGRGGIGGIRNSPSPLLIPECFRVGDFVNGLSPTGRMAESVRVIRGEWGWGR